MPIRLLLITALFFNVTSVLADSSSIDEYHEQVREEIKNIATGRFFSCGGLGIIDHGTSMDGDLTYFQESPRELISICGFGSHYTPVYGNGKVTKNPCAPDEWVANNCEQKYMQFRGFKSKAN